MESKPIYGLHSGLLSGQHDRVDELNDRILGRAFDNKSAKPVFDPRAASTKYTLFPILDRRPKIYLDDKADPVGQDVETETDLYGRKERIGAYDSGSKFRPSLESDMYKITVGKPTDQPPLERALLFERPTFMKSIHPNTVSKQIGNDTFNNHTRTQLRGSN